MHERTIMAVSAGLGQPSSTRLLTDRLAEATTTELESHSVTATVETVELRDIAHDVLNHTLTGFPSDQLRAVLEKVSAANGLIVASPLFNTSYSGLFKSFVDVLDSESLAGMPVLLGATGGTPRHSLALEYAMRPLFTYLHADVVTTSVFAATDDWAGDGDRTNPLPKRIQRAGRELAEMVAERESSGPADPFDNVPSFDQLLGGA
ncbi:FMN reductase [Parasphingorhabdus pacifica]